MDLRRLDDKADIRLCNAVITATELCRISDWYSERRGQHRGRGAPPLSASQQPAAAATPPPASCHDKAPAELADFLLIPHTPARRLLFSCVWNGRRLKERS